MFVALLLGQVASALFGSVVDQAAGGMTNAAVGSIRSRLARGRIELPSNHDLERAHRESLRSALRYLLAGLLPLMLGRRPGRVRRWWSRVVIARHAATAGYGPSAADPRLAWCRALERAARDDDWLDGWSLGTLDAQWLEELASAEIGDAGLAAFHEIVVDVLDAADLGGPMPAEVAEALRQGWQVEDPPGGGARSAVVTLYGSYCLFFQDAIARDPAVAKKVEMNSRAVATARHAEVAAAIAAAPVATADVVTAVREQVGPALALLADKLDALGEGLHDVALVLAEQTTALARVETLVQRVDETTLRVDETTLRVDETTLRVDETTLQIKGATTRIEELATRTQDVVLGLVRGHSLDEGEVAAIVARYRAWVQEDTRWLQTEASTAAGERLRLPLRDLWIADVPLLPRVPPAADGSATAPEVLEPRTAVQALDRGDAFVLGGPGSGKSTLVRWLVHHHAGDPARPAPPVLVRCRDLRGEALSHDGDGMSGPLEALVDHCVRSWGTLSNVEIAAVTEHLVREVRHGRSLLAVDGLDEITDGDKRLDFATRLGDVLLSHPEIRFVVTTRDLGSARASAALAERLAARPVPEEVEAPPTAPSGVTTPETAEPGSFASRARQRSAGSVRGHTYEIAALDADHRARFIEAWGRMRGLSDEDVRIGYGPLLRAVRGSGDVGRLAQNVFMLSLLAQAQDEESASGGRSLPVRRRDLFRRIVEYRVAGQRGIEPPITLDELVPRLEHVALAMVREGVVQLAESDLHALLRDFDEALDPAAFPTVAAVRTVSEVAAAAQALGLLLSAGPGPSRRGIPQGMVQFFHLSFQEYFAGSGLVHRWCEPGDLREEIVGLAHSLEAADPSGGAAELDARWLESFRHAVDRIDGAQLEALWFGTTVDVTVDELLLPWLPPQQAPAEVALGLAGVGLVALAGISELTGSGDVAGQVVAATAAAQARVADRGAFLAGAAREVFATPWRSTMVQRYLHEPGEAGRRFGVLLLTAVGPIEVAPDQLDREIAERLAVVRDTDPVAQAQALMEVLEILFEAQACVGPEERVDGVLQAWGPAGLGDEVRDACWDLMLDLIEEGQVDPRLPGWVLVWLTGSPRLLGDTGGFTHERADRLRTLVRTSPLTGARDPDLVADLTTVLTLAGARHREFALADWIYLWAVVADGGLAQRELNAPGRVWNTDDGEWVCEVLAEYGGQPARRLALAAGRFGATDPRMRQPLWELATDPDSAFDDRDEAMFYLARLGDEEVVRDLLELVRSQGTGPDHEDADGPSAIVLRATLALLAIGDLAALEELGQPGPLYDRAYLLALAGSADPRGVGVVEHMARSHPDLDHRAEAAEVLQVVAELLDPDVEEGPGDDDEPDPGDEPDAEAA